MHIKNLIQYNAIFILNIVMYMGNFLNSKNTMYCYLCHICIQNNLHYEKKISAHAL